MAINFTFLSLNFVGLVVAVVAAVTEARIQVF
jgi:hypothetical protein